MATCLSQFDRRQLFLPQAASLLTEARVRSGQVSTCVYATWEEAELEVELYAETKYTLTFLTVDTMMEYILADCLAVAEQIPLLSKKKEAKPA